MNSNSNKTPVPLVRSVFPPSLPPSPSRARRPQIKSFLSYSMLMMIVGGVGLACVKEGKGVDINMAAFGWASFANLAGAVFKIWAGGREEGNRGARGRAGREGMRSDRRRVLP
jgi:hypothetical protein